MFTASGASRRLCFERLGSEPPPALNFAPIVDIILQLICFYLFVAGSIQSRDDPSVRLPVMSSPAAVEELPVELVVNVRADGSLTVNDLPVEWEGLKALMIAQGGHASAAGQPSVSIRIDRRQSFAQLDRVLTTCRDLGLPRVSIRTTTEDAP